MAHKIGKLSLAQAARDAVKNNDISSMTAYLKDMGLENKFPISDQEWAEAGEQGMGGYLALFKRHGSNCPDRGSSAIESSARKLVESIFKNLPWLRDVLDRHEATLHRQWSKKSNQTRHKILVEAWGTEMAKSHRPDFEALEHEDDFKRAGTTRYRDSYMWPYINKEDLCNPRSLLLLMSTRARHHPSELALSEFSAHSLGRCAHVFGCEYLEDYRMNLTSRGGADTYGRLWNSDTDPDRFATLTSRHYQHPSVGLLVLEAQERVLSFLVDCVKLIMHDHTACSLLQGPLMRLEEPSSMDLKTEYASLSAIAADAPYQPPAAPDFARIASLLSAKRDHAADHFWSLREDPGYFEAHMLQSKEHRDELVLDCHGRQHPICAVGYEDKFWARVVGTEIYHAYQRFDTFAELQRQANLLKDMQKSYADEDEHTTNFPEPYTKALSQYRFYVYRYAEKLSTELARVFSASPSMRPWHTRAKPETNPDADWCEDLRVDNSFLEDPTRARLAWLLNKLWSRDDLFEMIGLTDIVDELQRLIGTEQAAPLISDYISSIVGDLTIMCQCIHQLEMYEPWALTDGLIPKEHDAQYRAYFENMHNTHMADVMLDIIVGIDKKDCALGRLGNPTDGRFAYPVAKRRTRENVELMRRAEDKLDNFWRKVDHDIETRGLNFAMTGESARDPVLTSL